MSIAMVDEAEREVLATETALMAVGGFTNSSSLAKYTYSSRSSCNFLEAFSYPMRISDG
jgi:hypothetical protein